MKRKNEEENGTSSSFSSDCKIKSVNFNADKFQS